MSSPAAVPVTENIVVASQKSLRDMTSEEKVKRYRELRGKLRQASDQSSVQGEPNVHYFWANKFNEPELLRLQGLGYTIIQEPKAAEVLASKAKPKIQAAGLKPDGTYTRGDVILMQIPQEEYDFFLLDIEQRHEEHMNNIVSEFQDEAEKVGAPTFTVDRKK